MKKPLLILTLLIIGVYQHVQAQYMLGTTGMMNIPTADRQKPGTVMLGINYLPTQITPERFNYNTGNYFINISFFSFLEFTYRETLVKGKYMSSKARYNQQDRSYSIRLCILKENQYLPGVALGTNDPIADKGANTFQSYYGVITKNIYLNGNILSSSIGYYISGSKNNPTKNFGNKYKGIFGGVSYIPAFCKELKMMAEYDSDGFNVGAAIRLWKHMAIHAFTHDFNCVSGGVRYECTLIH